MSFPSFNIGEILAQFTPKQRVYVLVFTVVAMCVTGLVAVILSNQCSTVEKHNERLDKDVASLRTEVSKLKKDYESCQKINEEIMNANLTIIRKVNELQFELLSARQVVSKESLMLRQLSDDSDVVIESISNYREERRDTLSKQEILINDIINIAKQNIHLNP